MRYCKAFLFLVFLCFLACSCNPSAGIVKRSHVFNVSDYQIKHRKKVKKIKVDFISRDSVSMANWFKIIEDSKVDSAGNKLISAQLNLLLVSKNIYLNLYAIGLGFPIVTLSLFPVIPSPVILVVPLILYGIYKEYYLIKYTVAIGRSLKSSPKLNNQAQVLITRYKFIKE
jgi:hypothetical protein